MSIPGPLGPTAPGVPPGAAPHTAGPVGAGGALPPSAPARSAGPRFAELVHAPPRLAQAGSAAGVGPLRAAAPEGASEGLTRELGRVIAELRVDERRLDRFVRRATRGSPMELPEMLAMQSLVYRYSQRVELLSKLVERMTSAVRQTLQTQL